MVENTSGKRSGVRVEAASPALIEKVRSTLTDGAGLYRLENLAPGVYTVTYSLPGFSNLQRSGVELQTGIAADPCTLSNFAQ